MSTGSGSIVNIISSILYLLHVKGSFLDRDDKKRSTSMDTKPGRRGFTDDFIEDFADVSSCNLLHTYCYEIYYLYLSIAMLYVGNHHHHHIRFWYLRCCGCPGLRGRQHLATPHTRSP